MTMKIDRVIEAFNRSGLGRRAATLEAVDKDARAVTLAFSSGQPVRRWFGNEILGHRAHEVRLDRLQHTGPLLMDHNPADQVGVVERVWLDADGVGRARVRFGKAARATDIFNDVVDGIRRNVSVGYTIHAMERQDDGAEPENYRVTDWEPCEISIVAVPADTSVGVGRAQVQTDDIAATDGMARDTVETVKESAQAEATEQREQTTAEIEEPMTEQLATTHTPITPTPDQAARDTFLSEERARVDAIYELGKQYDANDLAQEHARNQSGSVESLTRAILERQGKNRPVAPLTSDIGMDAQDLRRFSIVRIARALMDPGDRAAQKAAVFEREVSEAASAKQRSGRGNWVIPSDVLRYNVTGEASAFRDGGTLSTGSNGQTGPGSTGGATVATSFLAGSYIEALRDKAVFTKGTRMLGGLTGNIDIPKQTGTTQGYWIGEGDDAPPTQIDFGTVTMSPKTAAAYTDVTRRLLMQTSLDIEMLLRADLAKSMALAIDYSGYYGTGTDKQPKGLMNLDGLTIKTLNGPFPTYGEIVDLETEIAEKNADIEGMRFKARPSFKGYAKQTVKFATAGANQIWEPGNTVNGYACDISNQIQPGDMFFGNFSDIIMGLWGGLEINVDPYSLSRAGSIRIVTFQDIDWAVRRPESFMLIRGKKPDPVKKAA